MTRRSVVLCILLALAVSPAATALGSLSLPSSSSVAPPSGADPARQMFPSTTGPMLDAGDATSGVDAPDVDDAADAPTGDAAADESPLDLPTVPTSTSQYVVGFRAKVPHGALAAAGANIVRVDTGGRFVVVDVVTPDVLTALEGIDPEITYVERNGALFVAGATWDASRWDGATWDGATWDGATWDAARWDGATWDGATWDAAQWDGATWDGSTWDAAQWDSTRWDASRWDSTERDASRWDVESWNGAPRADPGYGAQWHLGATHATQAWRHTAAYHTPTICSVDSGVDATHPDLARNIRRLADGTFGYDFVGKDKDPSDVGGHGTHTAGIAAAVTGNGHGIAGMSQAWILAVRVLDGQGSGTEANLASGIRWCADNDADIVLLALHMEKANRAVEEAIAYAANRGVLVVAASGNGGARCATCVAYPAAYDTVLSVGATAPDGSVAPFSNGGDKLDLVAPGVKIPGPIPGNRYAVASGTSQATAVAVGAAALVWAAQPGISANDLREALEDGAKDAGTVGYDPLTGHGHLRVDLALRELGFRV